MKSFAPLVLAAATGVLAQGPIVGPLVTAPAPASTSTFFIYQNSTTVAPVSIAAATTAGPLTTLTVFTEQEVTITACPETVVNCPLRSTTTTTYTLPVYTTICPLALVPSILANPPPPPPPCAECQPIPYCEECEQIAVTSGIAVLPVQTGVQYLPVQQGTVIVPCPSGNAVIPVQTGVTVVPVLQGTVSVPVLPGVTVVPINTYVAPPPAVHTGYVSNTTIVASGADALAVSKVLAFLTVAIVALL